MSGAVFSPFTTSSSFITLAGEKKCAPATSCGREVALAISSMFSAEVFDSISAPGFITASSFANTSFFGAICSNTASTTASASPILS